MLVRAEIVAIGNEVLDGDVLDTNSHWLCEQITGLGGQVERVTQVRDDVDVISRCLLRAVERGVDLVVTSGGLGPTADDLTLEAVAVAVAAPLETDARALSWVAERYAETAFRGHVTSPCMTLDRQKMARLPLGAEPLWNGVGTAPGVLVRWGDGALVCLPGVPSELKHIYSDALSPLLGELFGQAAFDRMEASVGCGDESILAPMLRDVAGRHTDVYIKSRARGFGESTRFKVTLSARGSDKAAVGRLLQAAWEDLSATLSQAGIDAEMVS